MCFFFQTIHLLDAWRHLKKLQSLWSMLEDTHRVNTRWWFHIIIDYWYMFKRYTHVTSSTFIEFLFQMLDWHTYRHYVAWWHQICGCGSSWGAKRVLRCTTLKVLNEFYDVPRSKLWRLKFCNKIYVWVHDQ